MNGTHEWAWKNVLLSIWDAAREVGFVHYHSQNSQKPDQWQQTPRKLKNQDHHSHHTTIQPKQPHNQTNELFDGFLLMVAFLGFHHAHFWLSCH